MKKNLNFLIEIQKLKELPRTGWVLRKVKNPETIAEHTFGVAITGWILATKVKPKLNLAKIIKEGLAHNPCEVYAGDVTPFFITLENCLKIKKKGKNF